mmetsp:Transcript_72410/g.198369  ORF Transcript_72410/g.198369 Transcript_72410/m.198369 type:complete len:145 (+) Transcript_72410:475-909(+)
MRVHTPHRRYATADLPPPFLPPRVAGELAASLALLEKLESEPAEAAPRRELAWPPPTAGEADAAGGGDGDIIWWRGRWCVKEMRANHTVFVGMHGTSLVVVNPTNERQPCSVGVYSRVGGRPRICGGEPGWTTDEPPSFSLKGV